MNCKNCGAPMVLADNAHVWRCGFCESSRFSGELDKSEEGIVSLNKSAEIDCPSCQQEMEQAMLDKNPVVFCRSCEGFLIHAPSMSHSLQNKRKAYTGPDDEPILVDQEALKTQRKCPICENQFETYPYYGPGNCIIDSCRPCEMIWLDRGEFSSLIRAPGTRNEIQISAPQPMEVKKEKRKDLFGSSNWTNSNRTEFDLGDVAGVFFSLFD